MDNSSTASEIAHYRRQLDPCWRPSHHCHHSRYRSVKKRITNTSRNFFFFGATATPGARFVGFCGGTATPQESGSRCPPQRLVAERNPDCNAAKSERLSPSYCTMQTSGLLFCLAPLLCFQTVRCIQACISTPGPGMLWKGGLSQNMANESPHVKLGSESPSDKRLQLSLWEVRPLTDKNHEGRRGQSSPTLIAIPNFSPMCPPTTSLTQSDDPARGKLRSH